VIGVQTQTASSNNVIVEQQRAYFDHSIPPSPDSIAEGLWFTIWLSVIGSRVKPISATYFERQDERTIASDWSPWDTLTARLPLRIPGTSLTMSSPCLPSGHTEWKLPRQPRDAKQRASGRPALDLGCGALKTPGFWGMDRYPLPGVDFVGDFDAPLPFADDTFDLVFASHSLEHVRDLVRAMQEIIASAAMGRRCVSSRRTLPRASILPTPTTNRVSTSTPHAFGPPAVKTAMEPADYWHPQVGMWGLSQSDNSDPGIDFRCLRMQFTTFLSIATCRQRSSGRRVKKFIDVCDQIIYHLLVIKQPATEDEVKKWPTNRVLRAALRENPPLG